MQPLTKNPPRYVQHEPSAREIQILNDILPIKERTYDVDCRACTAQLRFHIEHTKRIAGLFRTYLTIHCPICKESIDVTGLVEPWIARNIPLS